MKTKPTDPMKQYVQTFAFAANPAQKFSGIVFEDSVDCIQAIADFYPHDFSINYTEPDRPLLKVPHEDGKATTYLEEGDIIAEYSEDMFIALGKPLLEAGILLLLESCEQEVDSPCECLVRASKTFRKRLDEILQEMKDHADKLMFDGDVEAIRNHRLSITHLEDVIMRQGMVLKALGTANPYPESKNPDSPVVEPTADGLKL